MSSMAGGAAHRVRLSHHGTELSNCLIRAQQAAYAGKHAGARTIRLIYVEGGTVYFYLSDPGRADEALLERLRRGLLRELGFSPHLEQLLAG